MNAIKAELLTLYEELLISEKTVKIRATGQSMWPYLRADDYIFVAKKRLYDIGDIVVVRYEDRLLLHRLIRTHNNQITIKGDNVRIKDPCTSITEVLGKAVKFERRNKIVDLESTKEKRKAKIIATLSPILYFINYPILRVWYRLDKVFQPVKSRLN